MRVGQLGKPASVIQTGLSQWLDQTLPSLVDLGASRVFWFQLDENPYAPSGFGLLGSDLVPRPAYVALQSLVAASQVAA